MSPDGAQIAYLEAWGDPDDHTRYRSQLMLTPFDGSSPPRALTSGRHRDSAPRWAPNGCSLAFAADWGGQDADDCLAAVEAARAAWLG